MGKKKVSQLALKASINASSKATHEKVGTQKKTANSISEDIERLKFALSTSRIGIWEMDLKSKFILWDDSVYVIFGIEKSAFKNTFEEYINLVHPDDRESTSKTIENAINKNIEFYIEHRVLRGVDNFIWVEGMGKSICDEKGEPLKLIGTVAEITARKNAEIELQKRDLLFNTLSNATKELVINPNQSDAINKGLSAIGEAIEIDRVYLFENDKVVEGQEPATSQRFEWNSGSAEPQMNNPELQHFPLAQFEPCTSILASGQHFACHVRNLEDSLLKEVLSAQQIQSLLIFPIIIKNDFWGFVGFDACKTEVEWSNIQLSALRSYAAAVSGAIESEISENEKQEWKTRYELIAASSGQVIYDYDIKSGNIVWGGNVEELLGYHKREMGDINQWIAMIHPNDRDASIEKLDEAEKNLSHYEVVYRFCHKDGNYLTMHDSGFFLPNADGKAYRMLGMMRDITEMKKAEDELRESEERYRTLLGASFSGIGIHDLGVFIEVNQGLADVSGYSVEELIGMQSLQLVAPEFRPIVIEKIKSGDESPYDVEAIHKNGSKRYLEIHGKNIPYKNKTVRVTEFRDVTDRKIAEEKVLEQNERLSSIAQSLTKKNEQLEEFTQIVSHNLRSPVGNIMSLLAILSNSNDTEERSQVIKLLERSSNYLLTTLNELNDILKVKQDVHLEKQNLKFEDVFEKVKQMMTVRINETSVQLRCDFEMAPEINYPNIYLESIFLNLLSNALKYRNPNRNLEVCFRTYYKGKQLFMEVSDNGLGIDLNRYRHQVFKLRKTFHENVESRGVGLFLIKTQIETMGGEISINSEENVGTTFVINFNKEDS